jgi:hypothetical protein
MTVKLNYVSGSALRRTVQAAALAAMAALLVACGGDSDCSSPPAFEGEQVGDCQQGGNTTPRASDLSINLSTATLSNDGSSTVTATVTAVGSGGVAQSGIPVRISVNNNAVATVSGTTTSATGVVVAQVGIGSDRANRSITVTATSSGITRTASFQVIGASLSATALPAVIAPGTAGQVVFRLTDVN